jgi:hypothetical protein
VADRTEERLPVLAYSWKERLPVADHTEECLPGAGPGVVVLPGADHTEGRLPATAGAGAGVLSGAVAADHTEGCLPAAEAVVRVAGVAGVAGRWGEEDWRRAREVRSLGVSVRSIGDTGHLLDSLPVILPCMCHMCRISASIDFTAGGSPSTVVRR